MSVFFVEFQSYLKNLHYGVSLFFVSIRDYRARLRGSFTRLLGCTLMHFKMHFGEKTHRRNGSHVSALLVGEWYSNVSFVIYT